MDYQLAQHHLQLLLPSVKFVSHQAQSPGPISPTSSTIVLFSRSDSQSAVYNAHSSKILRFLHYFKLQLMKFAILKISMPKPRQLFRSIQLHNRLYTTEDIEQAPIFSLDKTQASLQHQESETHHHHHHHIKSKVTYGAGSGDISFFILVTGLVAAGNFFICVLLAIYYHYMNSVYPSLQEIGSPNKYISLGRFIWWYFRMMFFEYFLMGIVVASIGWIASNGLLSFQQLKKIRFISRLFPVQNQAMVTETSISKNVPDTDVFISWKYCFDLHLYAYVPYFTLTFLIQTFFLIGSMVFHGMFFGSPSDMAQHRPLYNTGIFGFIGRLFWNTAWISAIFGYNYVLFLGYNSLPHLPPSQYLLFVPALLALFVWIFSIIAGWNIVEYWIWNVYTYD